MISAIAKKTRFLREINTLYSYILLRSYVKLRTMLRLPPLYPYENSYVLDAETQRIVGQLQDAIPAGQRGDNPNFNKNWKSIEEREKTAVVISGAISQILPQKPSEGNAQWLDAIKNIGYGRLAHKNLTKPQVDEIVAYLNQQKVYPAHVAHFAVEKAKSKEAVKRNSSFGSYDMQTIIKAPYVAELLTDPEVMGSIADYFGCLPTISSVNLFWAFAASDGKSRGPQRFHRDVDDYKTCTMFINLTDTTEDEGGHCYIEKSHTLEALKSIFIDAKNDDLADDLNPYKKRIAPEDFFQLPLNGYSFDKLYEHFFKKNMVNLHGERGMVLITDNYGIHRGVPSKRNDRLILWVSFSLTATHTQSAHLKPQQRTAYSQIKNRINNSQINRYVLRDVVDFTQ